MKPRPPGAIERPGVLNPSGPYQRRYYDEGKVIIGAYSLPDPEHPTRSELTIEWVWIHGCGPNDSPRFPGEDEPMPMTAPLPEPPEAP